MKVGDRIRLQSYMFGTATEQNDYTIEKFRHCLGIFLSASHRTAGIFTPLCSLYERGPESKTRYIPNFGEYDTNQVQAWMDITK